MATSSRRQQYGREPLILSEQRWLRFGAFCAFYFAQGVPIGLLMIAIPAWLAEEGASVSDLAVFTSVVSLPWAFKLVAGPFMDRFKFLPMGYRRPWVMGAQTGLCLSLLVLVAMGDLDIEFLLPYTVIGFVINAFAATQDVAVDGMAIDILPEGERGRANAFMAAGQVVGFNSYGALCGTLLPMVGLPVTALVCAVTVAVIFVLVAAVRERPGERTLPWTRGQAAMRSEVVELGMGGIFRDVVRTLILPMSLLLIAVEFLNCVRDGIALAVFPSFGVTEIGVAAATYTQFTGGMGIAAAIIGVLLGPLIDLQGAKRFLMISLVAGAACHVATGLLTELWQVREFIIVLYFLGAVAGQLIFVAIIAMFMNLCWTAVAATQFSVYMALANVSRAVGGFLLALVADHLSFSQNFLIMGGLLGLAALLLVLFDQSSHARRLGQLTVPARESAGTRA